MKIISIRALPERIHKFYTGFNVLCFEFIDPEKPEEKQNTEEEKKRSGSNSICPWLRNF